MKRSTLLLLTVVLVAGLARCGSEDDDPYNFGGLWQFTETIQAQKGTWSPLAGPVSIAQDGDGFLTLIFPGQQPAEGLCNPEDGTFTAQLYTQGGKTACSYRGHAEDESRMSGTSRCLSAADGSWASFSWTAELINR